MATNVKAKKKKGTYDNKLIKWIAIGLGALVAVIVAVFLIVTFTTNYVGKVAGQKIYTYEYNYYLRQAISEEYQENFDDFKPEGYDDLSDEEQDKVFKDFFDDTRKAKCEEAALEEARKFKAEYKLAVENGYKLTSSEKSNVKSNIDYYIYMYVNYYGYSEEVATYVMTQGAMTLSEYKDFMIRTTAIEKYKNALKEGYEISDDELKAKYDEEPNDYRTVSGRVFQFSLPTVPAVPKDDDGNEIKADTTDEALAEKYKKYQEDVADYNAQIANFLKLAAQMKEVYDKNGKYTLYDYDMTTFVPKTDDDGKEVVKAENATFEEISTSVSSWTSASSNKGVITVNNNSSSGVDKIDELLLATEWNAAKNGFTLPAEETEDPGEESTGETSSSAEDNETDKDTDTAVTPSEVRIIEVYSDDDVLTGLYLVRVEDINDFDSAADDTAEDGLNTVKTTIKTSLLEEKAVAELEAKVEAAGSRFALKSVKKKQLAKIMNEVMGE